MTVDDLIRELSELPPIDRTLTVVYAVNAPRPVEVIKSRKYGMYVRIGL